MQQKTASFSSMPTPRHFLRPYHSKMAENKGLTEFYYLPKVGNFAKFIKKHGLCRRLGPYCKYTFFSKQQIDKLPKQYRRGGIYGHDSCKILILGPREPQYLQPEIIKHVINLCKIHNIPYQLIRRQYRYPKQTTGGRFMIYTKTFLPQYDHIYR